MKNETTVTKNEDRSFAGKKLKINIKFIEKGKNKHFRSRIQKEQKKELVTKNYSRSKKKRNINETA